jgi:hypothetical protein
MLRLGWTWVAAGTTLAAVLVGCFNEDGGECSAGIACPNRGEACDLTTKTCEPQNLDVDGTAPAPGPTDFTRVLPFFRGKVCMPTKVQPGDKIPVHVEMCHHSCVTPAGFQYKSQYKCSGSVCDGALVVYLPGAQGAACPTDVFGKFAKTDCTYFTVDASVGGFSVSSIGPITGNGTVEIPFLTNDDADDIVAGATTDQIWDMIYKYPQDAGRVFNITMNGANPKAPANCVDDPSLCDCKEIGF